MTVSLPAQLVYSSTGDGVTSQFPYPVRVLEAGELVVALSENGVETTLVLNTDYTLSGIGDEAGVTVTLTEVPTASQTVIRYRATAAKQIVNLEDRAKNSAEAVEQQLDRLAMVDQDHGRRIGDLEDVADELDQAVEDASASATAAATSATNAATSAGNAADSATAAAASAATIEIGTGPDLSIDTAKLLKRGDAADAIDAAVTPVVATRTALAAVATADHTAAYLTEAGREGTFLWDSTDLSTYVTADTQQGIYVAPSSDTTGASGAWVRVVPDSVWHAKWFGIVPTSTTGTAYDSETVAMFDLAALIIPTAFQFESGVYPYDIQWPKFTFQVGIWGRSSGSGDTIFYPRATSPDLTRGWMSSENKGASLKNFNIRWDGLGTIELKYGYSNICTTNTTRAGSLHIENVTISLGNAVDYGFYFDGTANPVAPVGNRDIFMTNCLTFGAKISAIGGFGVHHLFLTGCNVGHGFGDTATGTGAYALEIGGDADVSSYIVVVRGGCLAGAVKLDKLTSADIDMGTGFGNVENTPDVSDTVVRGKKLAGLGIVLQHNWADDCFYDGSSRYLDRASAKVTSGAANVTGDGTEYVVVFETADPTSVAGYPSSKCYDVATGKYTALVEGDHSFKVRVSLYGLTSSHTSATLKIQGYTAAGAPLSFTQRTIEVAPYAVSIAGRVTLQLATDIFLFVGQYAQVSVAVGGGTKTVGIRSSLSGEKWTGFEARLC